MRKLKNNIAQLNLVLFLASFVLLTFNSFSLIGAQQSHDQAPQHIASKQAAGDDSSSQQLSEKNETENENDFELQALTLPFSVSYFTVKIIQPVIPPAEPLAEKKPQSIYVSVRSFRI